MQPDFRGGGGSDVWLDLGTEASQLGLGVKDLLAVQTGFMYLKKKQWIGHLVTMC